MNIKNAAILFCFCSLCICAAEPFRVGKTEIVEISSEMTQQSVKMGYSDAVAFVFTDPLLFLQGIEIELKIPQSIIPYRNSMSYSLYEKVSPEPSKEIIDYAAEKIVMEILPSRLSFILQIPVKTPHTLKSNSYVTVVKTSQIDAHTVLLFRLMPVMKGLSDMVENAVFSLEIKPLYTNEGMLTLSFTYPHEEKKPLTVRIDENTMQNNTKPFILKPGMHHISIVSDTYRNEVRVFNIAQGKNTNLEIQLRDIAPLLSIAAPENAVIFLDEIELTVPASERVNIPTTAGVHSIRFVIGDYEIKKTVDVQNGKNYTVSLFIDAEIVETP